MYRTGTMYSYTGTIDNPTHQITLAASGDVTLLSPLSVGLISLTPSGGVVNTTSANLLTINNPEPTSLLAWPNTTGRIIGPFVRKTASIQTYIFPSGSTTNRGCSITPSSADSGEYRVEYFNANNISNALAYPLAGVSDQEYWLINKLRGPSATIQLTLNGPVPGATPADGIVVAKFNGTKWINVNGGAILPGNSTSGTVTSEVLDGFSPFTFGYGIIPVQLNLCPNGSALINANLAGGDFIWQVDTGNGVFTNITDNEYYSGTSTPALHLAAMPTSFMGYRYRCEVDAAKYSIVSVLRFANSWTGAVSNAWENSGNWSCNIVPDFNTEVEISSGSVVISSNVSCKTVKVKTGASLTINSGYNLMVSY
jgi:hypothetical protein